VERSQQFEQAIAGGEKHTLQVRGACFGQRVWGACDARLA